ncbi:Prolactin-3B1 [Cricetulus griseus]|nr:Prolactin-3B1 [Cricetulus griseus]
MRVLQAWEEPMKHMVAAVVALPDASYFMLSKTKELQGRVQGLLEGLKIILNRIQPGAVEDDITVWSGWSDLQSSDEDTRNIALYTLSRCLRRDTHKVDNYLKVLKCRDVHDNSC